MRKGNRVLSSAFLLGTTFLASPGFADNTVTVNGNAGGLTPAGVLSDNFGDVNATVVGVGTALISGGTLNNIGAAGTGASSAGAISQSVSASTIDLSTLGANTVLINGSGASISATNEAGASVNANVSGITTATISTGIANSISGQAIGASAAASISSRFDTVVSQGAGASTNNTVDLTAAGPNNTVNAENSGAITVNQVAIGGNARINNGISNFIGASAAGATASASVSQSANESNIAMKTMPNNTVTTGAVTATNNAAGTVDIAGTHPLAIGGSALIANSVEGSIAAQAIGASAGASISSEFNHDVTPNGGGNVAQNTVTTGTLSADNSATVQSKTAITGSAQIGGVNIALPNSGNNIGASAVGATAGSSINQVAANSNGNFRFGALPNNTVTTRAIDATNNGAVTATLTEAGASINPAGSGIGNSIMAQGVGASASAGITTRFDTASWVNNGQPSANVINPNNRPDVTATNSASVSATNTVSGASAIGNGVGNSIGASAVGATGSASITQSGFNFAGGVNLTTVPTNTVRVGDITATNNAAGAVTSVLIGTSTTDVSNGIGNSIVSQGIGASVSASITSQFDTGTIQPTAFSDQSTNRVVVGALSATNSGAINSAAFLVGSGTISNGIGNSIGASAIGATAGANINQSDSNSQGVGDNLTELPRNRVRVTDNITATNNASGAVDAAVLLGGAAHIANGIGNSIAGQAVGASAGATIASRFENVTTVATTGATRSANVITGDPTLFASNAAGVQANVAIPSALIDKGVGNNIGASATGASAGAGVDQSVLGSTSVDLSELPRNHVSTGNIIALNTGEVDVAHNAAVATSIPFTVTTSATISNGIGNSISGQAVGASANASIASRFDGVSTAATQSLGNDSRNHVETGFLAAVNLGAPVTGVTSIGTGATITNGVANSIGAVAVGGSAGAGISQSVSNTAGNTGMDLKTLPHNIVDTGAIVGFNSGVVQATLTVGTNATIGNGISNAISGQAVGASANASIASRFDNAQTVVALGPVSTNSVTTGFLAAVNTGNVTAGVTVTGSAAITDGVSNSIVAVALGASSGAGISQSASNSRGATDMDLTTLPSNTVSTGFIGSLNLAPVVATLTVTSNSTSLGAGTHGGISNTIGSQAVGASSSASITSQFASLQTGTTGTPSTNSVTVGGFGIGAGNTANVTSTTKLGNNGGPNAVSITNGVGNSIGASAVGASGIASITQAAYNSTGNGMALGTLPTNSITTPNVLAGNTGNISASLNILGNAASTTSIGGGIGNSISAQAIGASAGATIMQHINGVITK